MTATTEYVLLEDEPEETEIEVRPKKKYYCGNKRRLPDGYDDFGTPYQCLCKGVGTGIYIVGSKRKKTVGIIVFSIVIATLVFLASFSIFYITKPPFFKKKDSQDLSYLKLFGISGSMGLVSGIITWLIIRFV